MAHHVTIRFLGIVSNTKKVLQEKILTERTRDVSRFKHCFSFIYMTVLGEINISQKSVIKSRNPVSFRTSKK